MKRFYSIAVWSAALLLVILCIGHIGFEAQGRPEELGRVPQGLVELGEPVVSSRVPAAVGMLVQYNIFSPLRGAPPVAVENEPVAPGNTSRFELQGIGIFDGESGAILSGAALDKKKRYFRVGDEIGSGYVLREIARGQVILEHPREGKLTLALNRREKLALELTPHDAMKMGNIVFTEAKNTNGKESGDEK